MSNKCGLIAIVGRPNVGKSTVLNQILKQKISITSRKPQTTRYQIIGIHTDGDSQIIFVDTPGWQISPKNRLNRLMNREVKQALSDVDLVLMLCDSRQWTLGDEKIATLVHESGVPAILALNKIDLLNNKNSLLPTIAKISENYSNFSEFIPVCAQTVSGVEALLEFIMFSLPERPFIFPKGQVTDRPERFLCGEIIREKTMNYLGDELPYTTTVVIDDFEELENITNIIATIWVGRDSQKPIVIGKNGSLLKRIASDSRSDIEELLQRKVFMKVWVKTKRGWLDSTEAMKTIGLLD
ncbi:MAG: GTPase Era [Gammaproteobacteria bacterium]|jgi:GTPase|nr:GTPase Era [Pseudomonadota bacterium]MDG2302061.1 GTPase Era [Gammaproteobacteria bacterium]MBT5064967.1 GTPase Era [Pseudomonadota bacterium]MBT6193078.1 GTPase Era [Pseudomonadota bacterium]MBT6464198.1 GTPase Era [Pseudomonadota bacterium]